MTIFHILFVTGRSITFKDAEILMWKVANIFHGAGFRQGDVVGIMMENRVEYVPSWLGLSRLGVVSALLNTNLKGKGLVHCIKVAHCKAIIYSDAFKGEGSCYHYIYVNIFTLLSKLPDVCRMGTL